VRQATNLYFGFLDRLRKFRVLDPACGSGNFLYLALLALKDIEHRANIDAELLGMPRQTPAVGPEAVRGIEINLYAAELARVSVWIGEIQWMRRNGFGVSDRPILKPLDNIECRDALLNVDGSEAEWPAANVVIGNPPFLGDKSMLSTLGVDYVETLRARFAGKLPGGVDLVTYWFEKSRCCISAGLLQSAGLVATQTIRRGSNRAVLDRIVTEGKIFDAWSDEPWVVDGADVRVSLIAFGRNDLDRKRVLDGDPVGEIYSDLTTGATDLTKAVGLSENLHICFQGPGQSGTV
jgi:type II restriction/modification system DNA methylase subunit YeeA